MFCIVGTLVGVGVIGTRVAESSGGALSADATLLAPLGPAFSIWSVVYAGLAAYTLWQWLPASSTDPRARSTGWLAAASMVLNAGWLLVTQQGWLWASVVVILALVAVLGVLVQRLADLGPAPSLVQRVVVDGTFGLYLGWVAVATCANITATLVAEGVETSSPGGRAGRSPRHRRRRGGRGGRRGPHRTALERRRGCGLGPGLDRRRPAHRRAGLHPRGCRRGVAAVAVLGLTARAAVRDRLTAKTGRSGPGCPDLGSSSTTAGPDEPPAHRQSSGRPRVRRHRREAGTLRGRRRRCGGTAT